ncbi:MAG TPA: aminotransferase class V-fold PLP-dependent enzyme [Terriglobales bacterium]|nr:aminotransferase class V-fold PLP-dependent enzyme [Terriglobales bacterium]
MFDVEFARAHFPALSPAVSNGWALFDNAGGSVPLAGVIERVRDYMSCRQVQLGATYPHSVEAAARVAAGRRAAALLVNADPDEIVLGASSTANVRVLARAFRPLLETGDEIVVTNLDHETNVGAWRALEAEGVRIREWRFDPESLALRLEDLEPLLGPRTRLVCFTHCSNIAGAVHDAAALIRRIHEGGALACVDGVACAPHRRIDVRALDADFYFLSLYKVFGPHLGMLYGKRELLRRLKSQNHFFYSEDDFPAKLEPGSVVHELAASLDAIPEYLLALDERLGAPDGLSEGARLDRVYSAIAAHETALARPLLEFLRDRPGVRVLGPATADPITRAPTISFAVEGRDSGEFPPLLERERIAIRFGHFYAHRAIEALGLLPRHGVVRVSMVHYNTAAEVERLIGILSRALA